MFPYEGEARRECEEVRDEREGTLSAELGRLTPRIELVGHLSSAERVLSVLSASF
jgi:hypothetical protein